MPLRHRINCFFTEGYSGLIRSAVLSLLLMCLGMGLVFGVEMANGVLDRGWGWNTWVGFTMGFTFVCVGNALLYLIALDYGEEKFCREEEPLIWHKE